MSVRLKRLVTGAVLAPVIVMLASVSLLLWRLNQQAVLSRWVTHSDRVLAAGSRSATTLTDIESGVRGYLLTGSVVFLAPYETGKKRLSGELHELGDLVAYDSPQSELARNLVADGETWAAELRTWIEALRDDEAPRLSAERTAELLIADKSKVDHLRDLIEQFMGRERTLRHLRMEAAASATGTTFWSTAILLTAVGGWLAWFSRRQLGFVAASYADALGRAVASERVEREARESAQMAVLARDNFVSLVSHELKTPLTSLRLQLQTLLRHAERGEPVPPEQVSHKATAALRQVDRLNQLVSDLMDVSRLASGHLPVSVAVVDPAELLRRVLAQYEDDVRAAGCAVSLRVTCEVKVRADPTRLEQVVINLITNALKYGRGEPIEVEIGRVAERACVSFRDHGIGISRNDQDRIFQRFERAAAAQSFSGVGLGLYIVRHLTELMGGEIAVESELGTGATFRLWLPLA